MPKAYIQTTIKAGYGALLFCDIAAAWRWPSRLSSLSLSRAREAAPSGAADFLFDLDRRRRARAGGGRCGRRRGARARGFGVATTPIAAAWRCRDDLNGASSARARRRRVSNGVVVDLTPIAPAMSWLSVVCSLSIPGWHVGDLNPLAQWVPSAAPDFLFAQFAGGPAALAELRGGRRPLAAAAAR